MRTIRYKTHWAYSGPANTRRELLADFILDIFYLMESHGIIPPIEVLNHVLQKGGDNGGMGPGTTWRPFTITKEEYDELINALLTEDMSKIKQKHPYVRFHRITLDQELDKIKDYHAWLRSAFQKYNP